MGVTTKLDQITERKADTNRGAIRWGPFKESCGKCGARRIDKQLGLEPTIEEYVANMVDVFRLVRDLLAEDGTLWLNMGDSYAGSWGNQGRKEERGTQRPINGEMIQPVLDGRYPSAGSNTGSLNRTPGLKPKDLCGVPWRLAFALQADGWWLRQDIIWAKPNPMPESVTDRCTKAHEYIFLLTKRANYFYDAEAIRERSDEASGWARSRANGVDTWSYGNSKERIAATGQTFEASTFGAVGFRNKRSVWTIPSQPYPEAHFATFPEALVEPCVLAGTSQQGHCPGCGKGWERVVQLGDLLPVGPDGHTNPYLAGKDFQQEQTKSAHLTRDGFMPGNQRSKTTLGWQPSCKCEYGSLIMETVPGVVFDPFMGSGTVAQVAQRLGRNWLGCELSGEYITLQAKRTQQLGMELRS